MRQQKLLLFISFKRCTPFYWAQLAVSTITFRSKEQHGQAGALHNHVQRRLVACAQADKSLSMISCQPLMLSHNSCSVCAMNR